MYSDLPTLAQCQQFLALINIGRQAAGLPIREYLDFDGAEPRLPNNCLSANNLFDATGWSVGSNNVSQATSWWPPKRAVLEALNFDEWGHLPEAILRVTDPFDSEVPGLRARLIEADVVRG